MAARYGVDFGLEKQPNGDWIDLATGEIIRRDWHLRRLGWSELPECPQLPANATKEQKAEYNFQLEAYEQKCDQVLDRILSHQDKIDRWTNAHVARCKPEENEIAVWSEFLEPLAKKLGEAKLKGKPQSLKLASGVISFTRAGGWGFSDRLMANEHVRKQVQAERVRLLNQLGTGYGIAEENLNAFVDDMLSALQAVPAQFQGIVEPTDSIEYQKFLALVKTGELKINVEVEPGKVEEKPWPGTMKAPEDRFAKVDFKPPKAASKGDKGDV
jgi:hypothetical protein